ncbi:hypothetical protein [Sphingomonas sp. Leaf343]|uniref:hypothetical protein n=1 Tax=Sphingomonas sp. Leaf343 TaxID=1736345 RepID=UPI0006FBFD71|nr:hypothetical protein [Sphingomonas sp. Leaf343]KQR84063.1 hypothetical protein ASG07_05535 [Sphingomonas sp. Leaf343]
MIDTPPPVPSVSAIEHRLVACGLDRRRISVERVDELQSVVIVIRDRVHPSRPLFTCIDEAAPASIVQVEEARLQTGYDDHVGKRVRPQMLAEATETVTRLGLIDGFPKRADYKNLGSYAGALEWHCGLEAGSVLRVMSKTLAFDPPREPDGMTFVARYEKLLAAMAYATATGDLEGFSFIGIDPVRPR